MSKRIMVAVMTEGRFGTKVDWHNANSRTEAQGIAKREMANDKTTGYQITEDELVIEEVAGDSNPAQFVGRTRWHHE